MKNTILLLVVCFMFFQSCSSFQSVFGKKKEKEIVEKKEIISDYDKLFKDKKYQTQKGLITLHKIDNKLYFEFPLNLMHKEMLLSSVVSEISNNSDCYVGMSPRIPLHINFSKIGNNVLIRKVKSVNIIGDNELSQSIKKSNIAAIYKSFKINAYNKDSTAVVFDVTDFFAGDERLLVPFDSRSEFFKAGVRRNPVFVKDDSGIEEIKAFGDNVTITSTLSYTSKMGENMNDYISAKVKRTIFLLPEQEMSYRIADSRLPLTAVGKYNFEPEFRGQEPVYIATRWRIEPSDDIKYRRGELVEPQKPIVIYVDRVFSNLLKKSIKEGILEWNKAFKKIGFKNVIQVKEMPLNDPEFDADNIKYNCIRYVPSLNSDVESRTFIDPRSGEILHFSLFVCGNIAREISKDLFVNLAQADPRVRSISSPDDKIAEVLKTNFCWLMGTKGLGFTYNLTASAGFPIDSLRSPSFTQKYGTSPSALDVAKYNYIAQPGDLEKGVRLTQKGLGEYDYHVVKWLYKPIPEASAPKDEIPVLNKWISEKAGNPVYRYVYAKDCPDCGANDVGNDDIKMAEYGIRNIKYIIKNMNSWIKDEDDKDFSFRSSVYLRCVRKYYQYLTQVIMNVYGVYVFERKVGDPYPSYKFITKERQEKSLDFVLKELEFPLWLENKELRKNMEIMSPAREKHRAYMNLLITVTGGKLFAYQGREKNHICHKEYLYKLFDVLFEKTNKGEDLSAQFRYFQSHFFRTMLKSSHMPEKGRKYSNTTAISDGCDLMITDYSEENSSLNFLYEKYENISNELIEPDILSRPEMYNFGELRKLPMMNLNSTRQVYYDILNKIKNIVEKNKNKGSYETRKHYEYMLYRINKFI